MKRNHQFVLIALMFVSIHGNAQQVHFSGDHIPLDSFFSAVSQQTGYTFFYNSSLFKNASLISMHADNIPVDSAMRLALKNQPYVFAIRGKTIFITADPSMQPVNGATKTPEPPMLTGLVTDSSGAPIASATVISKETKSSVVTQENGKFQIRVNEGDSIMISSIGYRKIVVPANARAVKIVMQSLINPLEQVMVGGSFFPVKKKSEISSITVIDSLTLQTLPVTDIAEIYRGLVPGTNSYSGGDITQWFPTLTIRGAANEGISQIDVYVDGIEWAGGSGYLASLNKENIDRIEILRGPVSSTLYGTGSNGGIVLIFTKKGNAQSNGLFVSAGAGFIQSKWVPSSVFQQYYTVEKTMGFKNLGVSLGGTYQTNGAYLPGGGSQTGTARLGMNWNPDKKLSVNLAGYYAGTRSGESRTPVYDTCTHLSDTLPNFGVYPRKLTNKEDHVKSYFAGINISYHANAHWSHLFTFGYSKNDYHESPVSDIDTNGLKPGNYFQMLNRTTTIRYSNILNWSDTKSGWAASVMSGADYKNDYVYSVIRYNVPYYRDNYPANSNTGVFVQLNPSYKNIYLTAGLRYDYNKLFKNNHSLNPRIGLTTNFNLSVLILKPRISWGSGITAPSYTARFGSPPSQYSVVIPNADIKPQNQSGFDYAVELYDKQNRFSGEVVYYDNQLTNMFAESQLPDDPAGLAVFQYTNIGKIANRGWEFSGKYRLNRRLSVYGSFSIMRSVIIDSTGDYQSFQLAGQPPGTQLKNLPRHTAGLYINYNFFKIFRKKDRGSVNVNITEVDGIYSLNVLR
ncbi:MAG TPA: TonB-dependent receptor, partial [Puia sp.]|nr:TonB-dependent receptor [Puia sp.]